ncbi:MAG: carboxypeptidase regulatory-like domain-containing protein [Planctomycetota bacterium]
MKRPVWLLSVIPLLVLVCLAIKFAGDWGRDTPEPVTASAEGSSRPQSSPSDEPRPRDATLNETIPTTARADTIDDAPERRELTPAPVVVRLGRGTVLDSEGQPLPGARVFVVPAPEDQRADFLDRPPQDWYATGQEWAADGEGGFPIKVARPDVVHAIVARKPGYGWDFAMLDPASGEFQQPTLRLQRTASLRGRVVDIAGAPLARARVSHRSSYIYETWKSWPAARALYAEHTWEEVETDAAGQFTFCEVTRGEQDVCAAADGLAPCEMAAIHCDSNVVIRLLPAALVFGEVVDEDRKPVVGALLRTVTYGTIPAQHTEWVKSDENGRYTIDGALSGSIGVVVWTELDFAADRVDLQVQAGEHRRLDFVLHRETEIAGRVVDAQDRGIPGRRVVVESERDGLITDDVESGDDGSFRASGLLPGDTYRIWVADTEEYGPRYIRHVPGGTEDVQVRLLESGTLWGTVSFDGEPSSTMRIQFSLRNDLPGNDGCMRVVEVLQQDPTDRRVEIQEKTYSYRFWPAIWDIRFTAPGHALILMRDVAVLPGRAPRPLDLHFQLATPISGTVVDAATGQGIAGARVAVLEESYNGRLQMSPRPVEVVTDTAGYFTMATPPYGELSLQVRATGFAPRTLHNISVRPGSSEVITAALYRGGRVEGHIDTTYADPTSTLQIIVRELGRQDGLSTFAIHSREFAIEHVPPGRVEVVLNDHYHRTLFPGVEPQIRQAEVHDGDTVRVDFDAATGVTLKGRVVGWEKPLLIEARLIGGEGEPVIAGASYTDREGGFRIPHLRPGRYRVGSTAGQPGYAIAVAGEVTITSSEPDEFILPVPGNTVQGVVRGPSGEGFARAVVTIERSEPRASILSMCLTDGEGTFAIGGLEDGHYALRARARGCATELLEGYQAPGSPIEFPLRAEARLRVIVQDDTGILLPGARVGVRHTRKPKLTWSDIAGIEGTATFPGLQGESHEVVAALDGYLPADPLIVPLRGGQTQQVALVLVREGEIEVSVMSTKGRALEGVPVSLLSEAGESLEQRLTDENGKVLFRGLVAGWYEVVAGTDTTTSDAVEVNAGERATLDLTLGESE